MRYIMFLTAFVFAITMTNNVVFAQAPVKRNPSNNASTSHTNVATPPRHKVTNKPVITYAATGIDNGYGYVDLGLSVKWAMCNLGASSPELFGDYYAWGEVTPKRDYTANDYLKNNIGTNISGTSYDAARSKMGSRWRMPTKTEVQELTSKCKWQYTKYKGVSGFMVTGPNHNKLFIPAAGYYVNAENNTIGDYATFWTSNSEFDGTYGICRAYWWSVQYYWRWNPPVSTTIVKEAYYNGRSIRAVID